MRCEVTQRSAMQSSNVCNVCMHVMYVRAYARAYVCMYVCMYVGVYVCHVCMYVRACVMYVMYVCMYFDVM